MKKNYIPQARRVIRNVHRIVDVPESVSHLSQNLHDIRRAGIVDGVTSSTSLFDESLGEVPDIFNPNIDKFELADSLMRGGASQKTAQKAASDGIDQLEK